LDESFERYEGYGGLKMPKNSLGERNYTIRLRLGLVFITFPQGNRERNRDASNRYQAESNFSLTVYVGE
jgi:hypothetical protein